MAFHTDDILLYPLVFVALVMQKTYAVSKSALVPSVVRSDDELVEANSKLGLISGLVGALAIGPLLGIGHFSAAAALLIGVAFFGAATIAARQLPKEAIAPKPAEAAERLELRSAGVSSVSSPSTSCSGYARTTGWPSSASPRRPARWARWPATWSRHACDGRCARR